MALNVEFTRICSSNLKKKENQTQKVEFILDYYP